MIADVVSLEDYQERNHQGKSIEDTERQAKVIHLKNGFIPAPDCCIKIYSVKDRALAFILEV